MSPRLRISDHALVRFLERAGGLDVEAVRLALADSLARAASAAEQLDARRYTIQADGLRYVVADGVVITVREIGWRSARAEPALSPEDAP
jgi:hypothetical protein